MGLIEMDIIGVEGGGTVMGYGDYGVTVEHRVISVVLAELCSYPVVFF